MFCILWIFAVGLKAKKRFPSTRGGFLHDSNIFILFLSFFDGRTTL